MEYTAIYQSPLGEMLLAADEIGLIGVWFNEQKYYAQGLHSDAVTKETVGLMAAKKWLDCYFAGERPDFMPPIHMIGTPFQLEVWRILQTIPYGKTITYGEIAKTLAEEKGFSPKGTQAVGNAVGHNKISIIIPCHRVVGANGSLTGYAGGVEKKQQLLAIEGVAMNGLFVSAQGSVARQG